MEYRAGHDHGVHVRLRRRVQPRYRIVFDQAIGTWDTSSVTTMEEMFSGATAFNQAIGTWDTSKVTTMEEMFSSAAAFDQAIGTWDTSKVTTMEEMFYEAAAFDRAIGTWDTSSVTTMEGMFEYATAWQARYTNCGDDNSHSACSEFTSFASSDDADDGPPARVGCAKTKRGATLRTSATAPPAPAPRTLASGSSWPARVRRPGTQSRGTSSCLDRVLTRATCSPSSPSNPSSPEQLEQSEQLEQPEQPEQPEQFLAEQK